MLTDPQTITVNAVAQVMPRVLNAGAHSTYELSDKTYRLDVRHRTVKRDKKLRAVSTVQFTHLKIVADPLTAANDYDTSTWSVQLDRPEVGFTLTELQNDWTGMKTWFDNTMVGKINGRES